ncbi:hypothetical protein ACFS5J_04930 [Flavobacterium chuncheonense]|uniref:Uncharacterized protein n=1 Tax=Flavobacterium chuncheonense TaxID=2026653 RepID=A0ABW5YLQ7_9FLAO
MKATIITSLLLAIFIMSFATINNEAKEPKIENYTSLKQYIEKEELPVPLEKSLFLKNLIDFEQFAFFRKYNVKRKSINKLFKPDVYLFNSSWQLIDDNALGGCYIDRSEFNNRDYYTAILNENDLITKGPDKQTCSLELIKDNLTDYQGNSVFPFKENTPCILILWAKNKANVKTTKFLIEYNKYLIKNSKTEVDIFYLNVDNYSFQ